MYYVFYDVDYYEMGGVGLIECETYNDVLQLLEELKRIHPDSIDWDDIKSVNDHITVIHGSKKTIKVQTTITEYALEES